MLLELGKKLYNFFLSPELVGYLLEPSQVILKGDNEIMFKLFFTNTYQNVKLLPAFCKVDLSVYNIGIANVDECEILKHESYVWDARGARLSKRVPETNS